MSLIIALVVLGLIFYFVEMIPLAPPFAQIIRVVAIIIAVVYVLNFLGVHIAPLNLR